MNAMNRKERKLFIEILKLCYNNSDKNTVISLINRCDDDVLSKFLMYGVEGFLYPTFKEHEELFSQGFLNLIQGKIGLVGIKNNLIKSHLLELAKVFHEHNIQFICLKGIELTDRLYDDETARAVSDIDIVIDKNQYKKAEGILYDLGYYFPEAIMTNHNPNLSKEFIERELSEISFIKASKPFDIYIDLHFDMKLTSDGTIASKLYPTDQHDWFGNVQLHEIDDVLIPRLTHEYELINLIYHFAIHHTFFGIKWFIDICQMLNKYGNTLNWQTIDSAVQNKNLRRLISISLGMAENVIGKINYNSYIKSTFNMSDPHTSYYMKMMFTKGLPSFMKLKGKLLKVGLPASLYGRLKMIAYFLFDRGSIKNLVANSKSSGFDILQPFKLVYTLLYFLIKFKGMR